MFEEILKVLIAFASGGGLYKALQARSENALRRRQAEAIGVKTTPEVTEITVSTMAKVNERLTADYERVRAERDDYYTQLMSLRAEVEALQSKLDQAQDDLQAAHTATTALREQLDHLMATLPLLDKEGPS